MPFPHISKISLLVDTNVTYAADTVRVEAKAADEMRALLLWADQQLELAYKASFDDGHEWIADLRQGLKTRLKDLGKN